MAGTSGGGLARTGAVGMLGLATGVLVGATSMIGAHLGPKFLSALGGRSVCSPKNGSARRMYTR
uniref:Uncharacterized protein n=1 Tax=Romanomermis culicivorax TaxID=13658 RepID=A0A915KKT4_ROMCU